MTILSSDVWYSNLIKQEIWKRFYICLIFRAVLFLLIILSAKFIFLLFCSNNIFYLLPLFTLAKLRFYISLPQTDASLTHFSLSILVYHFIARFLFCFGRESLKCIPLSLSFIVLSAFHSSSISLVCKHYQRHNMYTHALLTWMLMCT